MAEKEIGNNFEKSRFFLRQWIVEDNIYNIKNQDFS